MVHRGNWVGAEGRVVQVAMYRWHCQHWHCQMLAPLVVEPVAEAESAAEIQQIEGVCAPLPQQPQRDVLQLQAKPDQGAWPS